jgi:hypothetical protein
MVEWLMKWWIKNNLEGSGHSLVKIRSWHFSWRSKDDHESLNQEGRCRGLDSNRAPTEYSSSALPLDQPVWSCLCFALRKTVCRLLLVLVRRWTMFSERRVGGTSGPSSHSSADVIHAFRFRASSLTFAWRRVESKVTRVPPVRIVGCQPGRDGQEKLPDRQKSDPGDPASSQSLHYCTTYCSDTGKKNRGQ